jgi:hypothetical protein
MPKLSGAMLDWVPQKAAQHTQSDAMTRFMPSLEQNPAAAPARRHLQSIRGREQALLRARSAASTRIARYRPPRGDGAEWRGRASAVSDHSAAISCSVAYGSASI